MRRVLPRGSHGQERERTFLIATHAWLSLAKLLSRLAQRQLYTLTRAIYIFIREMLRSAMVNVSRRVAGEKATAHPRTFSFSHDMGRWRCVCWRDTSRWRRQDLAEDAVNA